MRKGFVAAIVVAVLGASGAAGLPLAERYAASRIKAEIERGGQASVGDVEVGLIDRRVTLVDFRSRAFGDLTAGRWEASGLSEPLGDLLQGRTPLSDVKLGDPLRADRVELADAHFTDSLDGTSWSVGSLVIEGLDLAPYNANAADPDRVEILSVRIAGALRVRRLEGKNVAYTLPATGDAIAVRAVSVDRFDRGKVAALAIAELEATPKDSGEVAFRIDDLKAKDLDLQRILTQLAEGGRPSGRVDVGSASATGFGGAFLTRNGISLDGVSLETVRETVGSSRSRLRIDDLVLRPGANAEGGRLRTLLQAMGLSELKLDFDCAGAERRARGELAIDRCALAAAELGELSLAARFVDADDAFWRAVDDGNALALARSSIALASARLVLADEGGTDRLVRALAAAANQPPAVARGNLARDIRAYRPPDILITDDLTKLLDTAARFVEQGGTLVLEATPDPPLGLAAASRLSFAAPDVVRMFGLSAKLSR